jgi:hypothetical protein
MEKNRMTKQYRIVPAGKGWEIKTDGGVRL